MKVTFLLYCLTTLVCISCNTEFTPRGEPCQFPFEYKEATYNQCVEISPGNRFCKDFDNVWQPCQQLSSPSYPANRKVVPTLLPYAELASEASNFTSVETVDLTYVYYGECCAILAELGFQSNLPILIIETGNQEIQDEPKIDAQMCTCGSETEEYNGPIGIEIRGSTSARDYAKKSYALETRSADGSSEDVSLLGLPEENDWVLYGPEADKTMGFRNIISYTLARASGNYASRLKYCEIFITENRKNLTIGDYYGIYLLGEKIKRGKNRVKIKKQKSDSVDGGYIFKHDNDNNDPGDDVFSARLSSLLMILVYPKDPTPKQISFIKETVDNFEKDLSGDAFKHPNKGYRKHIDVDSFVDYFLLSEITKNPDSYRGSSFVHKDANGPLVMGPVWDYNEAYGMCCGFPIEGYQTNGMSRGRSGGSAISPEGWRFNICIDRGRCRVDPLDGLSLWYRRLWQDQKFRKAVYNRWTKLRAGAWSDENIESIFIDITNNVQEPIMRNYAIWEDVLRDRSRQENLDIWLGEVEILSEWLFARLEWLDEQMIKDKDLFMSLKSSLTKNVRALSEILEDASIAEEAMDYLSARPTDVDIETARTIDMEAHGLLPCSFPQSGKRESGVYE
eukprot:g4904.t1